MIDGNGGVDAYFDGKDLGIGTRAPVYNGRILDPNPFSKSPPMFPSYFSDPYLVASSQKYWFRGIVLATIGYGVNLTLFISCVNLLRHRISSGRGDAAGVLDGTRYKWDIFSLCYTNLIFGFATVTIVLEVIVNERAFVQPWISPAGPSIYLFDNVFGHVTILWPAYIAHASSHFLAEGLLVCSLPFNLPTN